MDCGVGAPQVNYRESISRPADIKYTHKKQSGGSGQFAEVSIRFEPGEPGSGFEFRSEIKGGVVSLPLPDRKFSQPDLPFVRGIDAQRGVFPSTIYFSLPTKCFQPGLQFNRGIDARAKNS